MSFELKGHIQIYVASQIFSGQLMDRMCEFFYQVGAPVSDMVRSGPSGEVAAVALSACLTFISGVYSYLIHLQV